MSAVPAADLELVSTLRDAVDQYLAAVDAWEASYRQYYRMPGEAKRSDDLTEEQRAFEERRSVLASLLPRARALCFKYGQPDVFAGLLHASLGEFAPQERPDSAIGRGERGAVMACLIELSIACRAADARLPLSFDASGRKPSLLDRILSFLG